MADLRSRFIEDYAGGLLNVSRQELSTTGEVLSQDGFTSEGTLYIEDGSGVKSGLRLGVALAECVDPTTETGVVNVRFADRTYSKIRDFKIFSTAISSAQAALSEATATSIGNLETTLQLLEDDISSLEQNVRSVLSSDQESLQEIIAQQQFITDNLDSQKQQLDSVAAKLAEFENNNPLTGIPPVNVTTFVEVTNSANLSGTIAISGGTVTGTNTDFNSELKTGDVIVATATGGELVEFTVVGFNSTTPETVMLVTPTNKTVQSGSYYRLSETYLLKLKVNELIEKLRTTGIFTQL